MALVSNIEIDINDGGRWFTYYTNPEDEKDTFDLNIESSESPGYKKLQRSIARRFANNRKSKGGFASDEPNIPDSQLQGVTVEFALELLNGWRGFQMTRGNFYRLMGTPHGDEVDLEEVLVIDYTKEIAKALFTNPGFAHMLEFVVGKGRDLSAHTKQHTEGAVGNSPPASDTI